MALCWLWASEGSCWQFPFSDLSAKPPPSCSPGRRGQVSGYWDGKGLESLRQVRVACVELIRRLRYSAGKPEVRYADDCAPHPLSSEETLPSPQRPVISWSYNFSPLNSSFGEALCLTGEHERNSSAL